MGSTEADTLLAGQAKLWLLMFGYVDSMALKCAVDLGIADIINSHAGPITLYQIASGIDSLSVDIGYLDRIMRFKVCKEIFTARHRSDLGDTLYGINHHSRWLLRDSNLSLAKLAFENSIELEPTSEDWYKLAGRMFANARENEEATDIRKMIQEKEMETTCGFRAFLSLNVTSGFHSCSHV